MHASHAPSVLKLFKVNNSWHTKFISIYDEKSIAIIPLLSGQKVNKEYSYKLTPINKTVSASERYKNTSRVKSFFMGKGYRREWSHLIEPKLLDIDTLDGGAIPYSLGGGLQTLGLKLKTSNGKKYTFRLLDKRPEKSLSTIAKESYYKSIVIELITTMHPYGPLVASHLLNQTDILHIKPKLYMLDENSLLKEEYAIFVGKLGTLEEKPVGKKKKRKGFADADDVVSTYEMMAMLRNSEHNSLDKMAFAKARLMDMFLGDWDRHEDNWKWAVYKKGKNKIFKPIPKDRDHVFSKWSGMIPSAADIFINNAEDFDYNFKNLRHLNFKSRFLDRALGSQLSHKDWKQAAEYLQKSISDLSINQAINKLPQETRDFHGQELVDKLINRRAKLTELAEDYYKEFNAFVEIVGTIREDRFTIETLNADTLLIKIFHNEKKKPFFVRKIELDLIDKIYLFGLGDDDQFNLQLHEKPNCKFHIIGGNGFDQIINDYQTPNLDVEVYDSDNEDQIISNEHIKTKSPQRHAHYEPYAFDYNWLIPKVWVKNSSGNGFGYSLSATYLVRGFNKPQFASKFQGKLIYYPDLNANRLIFDYTKRHFYGLWDFELEGTYSNLYDKFPFYYGKGINSIFNRDSRFADNRIDYNIAKIKLGLSQGLFNKSEIDYFIGFEHHDVRNYKDTDILTSEVLGRGKINYLSFEGNLTLDFTDNSNYPTDGSELFVNFVSRYSNINNFTSNVSARFTYYKSVNLGVLVTFAGGISYMRSMGESSFYHLSSLGGSTGFRGYSRNRYLDRNALLFNKEVRIKLGAIKTPIIKIIVGVIGIWDHGTVWGEEENNSTNTFKESKGGGFYLAPGNGNFTVSYYAVKNDDNETFSKIQLGFDF